jgi:glucokinase
MSDVYLGIDLGGSGSKLLLARGPGPATGPEPLWQHRIDGALTPGTLDALRATVHDGLARTATTVQAAGVTVPGIVDETTGVVRRSVNMPWLDGVSVPERFGALLGVPTVAVHDGRAAALAEARLGAGRGSDDVFVPRGPRHRPDRRARRRRRGRARQPRPRRTPLRLRPARLPGGLRRRPAPRRAVAAGHR